MRPLVYRALSHTIAVFCGLALPLLLCACGALQSVAVVTPSTSTAVAAAKVLNVHRVTTVLNGNVPGGGIFTNRATCPTGSVLLSGGYADPQSDPIQDSVTASYPASLYSWAVTAIDVGGPLTLAAFVDCAQPNFPDLPQLVGTTVNNATSAQIQCPAGTTVTGGGFKGSVTSLSSKAAGNGWSVVDGLSSPALTIFAICQGGGHVLPGSLLAATQQVPNLGQTGTSVSCPMGQSLAGGGYAAAKGAAPFGTYPDPTFSTWVSEAKFIGQPPNGTVTTVAVCVQLV
jgi:hypothetical protein